MAKKIVPQEQPLIDFGSLTTEGNGYCEMCLVSGHDVCSLTYGCPCCDMTLENMARPYPEWNEPAQQASEVP